LNAVIVERFQAEFGIEKTLHPSHFDQLVGCQIGSGQVRLFAVNLVEVTRLTSGHKKNNLKIAITRDPLN
jgi:hypothetical protein